MARALKLILSMTAALFVTACGQASQGMETPADFASNDSSKDREQVSEPIMSPEDIHAVAASEVNQPYNRFLSTYVTPVNGMNLVAYDKVTETDAQDLKDYIQTLSALDLFRFSDAEKMAYWFNLYNAETLNLILDNYPLDSIRDIKKPWDQKRLTVNGVKMSLNDIEHKTLRENYSEPRIHFAVNCASIGCPNLKITAWEAETLEADLQQAGIDYVASPRGISVNRGKVKASKIFDWYKKDFGSNEQDVLVYLSQFADGEKKTSLQGAKKINDYEYDWTLNIAK